MVDGQFMILGVGWLGGPAPPTCERIVSEYIYVRYLA